MKEYVRLNRFLIRWNVTFFAIIWKGPRICFNFARSFNISSFECRNLAGNGHFNLAQFSNNSEKRASTCVLRDSFWQNIYFTGLPSLLFLFNCLPCKTGSNVLGREYLLFYLDSRFEDAFQMLAQIFDVGFHFLYPRVLSFHIQVCFFLLEPRR